MTDKIAYGLVRLARFAILYSVRRSAHNAHRAGFDFVSRYKHKPLPPSHNMTLQELRDEGYLLDQNAWLNVSF